MIRIQNIYYMLCYAFHILTEQGYKSIETETFENTAELFAAILSQGVSVQIKRGLGHSYVPQTEALSSPRGKINIQDSIKTRRFERGQLVCTYDEYTVNSKMNQIVKSTMLLLISQDIDKKRKKELRNLLVYFSDVDTIDLHTVNWTMQYNRNNQTYRLLISICYLVVKGLLQTTKDGRAKLMDFLDEQRMCQLYEKFILEYYRKEWRSVKASASHIPWQLDDGYDELLPVMQTDIMLNYQEKTLIIDAKYYAHTLQSRYEKKSIHSSNLYQIFTYVKNKEAQLAEEEHEVSGMLLYAKTDEEVVPDNEYHMSGNRIAVRTLDLDQDFDHIRRQLDSIVEEYLY